YRLNEEDAPALQMIPNLLDAPDRAYAFSLEDGHVVVLGMPAPGRPIELAPALRAYSALLAQEAVRELEVPAAVADAFEQLKVSGHTTQADARGLVAESLRQA